MSKPGFRCAVLMFLVACTLPLTTSVAAPAAKKPVAAKAAPRPAPKPRAVAAPARPVPTIQNVRIVPDPQETERLLARELKQDQQAAQMLSALSMSTLAAQRAATASEQLLFPLQLIAAFTSVAALLGFVAFVVQRRAINGLRASLRELVRLQREAKFTVPAPARPAGARVAPTMDRVEPALGPGAETAGDEPRATDEPGHPYTA